MLLQQRVAHISLSTPNPPKRNHQHVARFFATEAPKLVDDIITEFAPRLATLRR